MTVKKLWTALLVAAMMAVSVQADFIRIEGAVGAMFAEPGGSFELPGGNDLELKDDLGIDTQTDLYFWAFLKHPLPVVPNVRIEYLGLNHDPDGADSFRVNEVDGILYYNFLDNLLWITLDVGLDIKYVTTDSDTMDSENTSLGLLYGRLRFEPLDWLGIETVVTATNYSDNKGYDARLKIDGTLTFVPLIQPAVELGYRIHKIQYKLGDVIDKGEYSGIYAGVMVRF